MKSAKIYDKKVEVKEILSNYDHFFVKSVKDLRTNRICNILTLQCKQSLRSLVGKKSMSDSDNERDIEYNDFLQFFIYNENVVKDGNRIEISSFITSSNNNDIKYDIRSLSLALLDNSRFVLTYQNYGKYKKWNIEFVLYNFKGDNDMEIRKIGRSFSFCYNYHRISPHVTSYDSNFFIAFLEYSNCFEDEKYRIKALGYNYNGKRISNMLSLRPFNDKEMESIKYENEGYKSEVYPSILHLHDNRFAIIWKKLYDECNILFCSNVGIGYIIKYSDNLALSWSIFAYYYLFYQIIPLLVLLFIKCFASDYDLMLKRIISKSSDDCFLCDHFIDYFKISRINSKKKYGMIEIMRYCLLVLFFLFPFSILLFYVNTYIKFLVALYKLIFDEFGTSMDVLCAWCCSCNVLQAIVSFILWHFGIILLFSLEILVHPLIFLLYTLKMTLDFDLITCPFQQDPDEKDKDDADPDLDDNLLTELDDLHK